MEHVISFDAVIKKTFLAVTIIILSSILLAIGIEAEASEYELRATRAFLEGDWNRVVQLSETWIKQEPANPIAHVLLAGAFSHKREYIKRDAELFFVFEEEARKASVLSWTKRLVENYPQNSHAHYILALAYIGPRPPTKYKAEAIRALKETIKLNPEYADAYFLLGVIEGYDTNTYDESLRALKEASRLDPQFVEAYIALGLVCGTKELFDEALSYYKKAVKTAKHAKPRLLGVAYLSLGATYEVNGQIDEAIKAYEEAIRSDPSGVAGVSAEVRIRELKAKGH